jgi:tetratricopeptide (TPR) repeat protein
VETWKRELAETIAKHRRQGWGWRYDGLEGWTTEAIFAQLRELGIDTDAERFREQAVAALGIDGLRKVWDGQIREEMDIAFWPDFPLIAVPLLWERLTPDLVCPELVEQRLYRAISAEKEGTSSPEVGGVPAAVAAAVGLAKYLEGFPAGERAKQFDAINRRGAYDYSNWLVNLIGDHGRKYPDAVMQIADVMADCVNGRSFQSESALVLAAAGRRSEAIQRVRAVVERFNDDFWARILAGDVYKEVGDVAEAKRLYAEALAMAREPSDRDAAAERLESVSPKAEVQEQLWDDLWRQRIAGETPVLPPMAASPPAKKKKVGRNDPCPCGSGKKYKKCCMHL